jgi:type III pantothenate kinase
MYYIDIGNSLIKIKTPDKSSWRTVFSESTKEVAAAAGFLKRSGVQTVGVSVVKDASTLISEELADSVSMKWFTHEDIPSKTLDYETPETLGLDRYMACLGARVLSDTPVIVIDAGTACTIDYMDDKGVYRGGVIMPGMKLWETALQQFAPALPQVERDIPMKWPGKSTENSVRWGLSGAFVEAVNGLVRKYDYLAKVWVTGGDGDWLAKRMERTAKVNDNLIFEGMRKLVEARLWFG